MDAILSQLLGFGWFLARIFIFVGVWLGFGFFIFWFIKNGLVKIPAKPVSRAVLLFLGKKTNMLFGEGWKFFPFRPFVFDLIIESVERVSHAVQPKEVMTPDNAFIEVVASIDFIPGSSNNTGISQDDNSLTTYINAGGLENVKKIFGEIIEDRIKTWAISDGEGPETWQEAVALRDDAHLVLSQALLGEVLTKVDSDIPAGTWMRFFKKPQQDPTTYDVKNGWGSIVGGAKKWDPLVAEFASYSQDKQDALRNSVDMLVKDIRSLREGKARFIDSGLGITIIRFSVGDIKLTGKARDAADRAEEERLQLQAEQIEADNFIRLVEKYKKLGLSPDKAAEVAQTERGKITKHVIATNSDLVAAASLIGGTNKGGSGGNP